MPAEHVAVISRDLAFTAEVRRLAALAGRTVLVAGQPGDCARVCRNAALVVVDADAADVVDAAVDMRNVAVVADDPRRISSWELAVRLGARRVLTLPAETAGLLDLIALAGERSGPPGPLIAVAGGSGGAGASVFAVALGWAFAQTGRSTTAVDLDVSGGGLDVLVGLERADGLRWHDLVGARGVVASTSLREQLPTVDGLAVLSVCNGLRFGDESESGLPDRAAMAAVLAAARRGGDVVVADLPRQCDEDIDAVVASCDTLLLVLPAQVRAVSAAACVVRRWRALCTDIRLVVRADGRRRLHHRDIAKSLALPHLATFAAESGVAGAVERGQLLQSLRRSALGRTARAVVDQLDADDVEQAS